MFIDKLEVLFAFNMLISINSTTTHIHLAHHHMLAFVALSWGTWR